MQPSVEPFVQKIYCPSCSQKLAISTRNLQHAYQCPRCHVVHLAGDLIAKGTTVPAIPVDEQAAAAPALAAVPVNIAPPELPASTPSPKRDGSVTAPLGSMVPTFDPARTPSECESTIASAPAAPASVPAEPVLAEPALAKTPLSPQAAPWTQTAAAPQLDSASLLRAARDGAATASALASLLLDAAAAVDSKLHGRRGWAFVALCGTVAVLEVGSLAFDFSQVAWELLLFLLLAVLTATVLVARIASLRDEGGRWSLGLVASRAESALKWSWESLKGFFTAPAIEKRRVFGTTLVSLGLAGVALSTLCALFLSAVLALVELDAGAITLAVRSLAIASWIGAVVGGFVLLARWFELRSAGGPARLDLRTVRHAHAQVLGLPPVLDFVHARKLALRVIEPMPDSVLKATLLQIAAWRPHKRFESEWDYQMSLFQKIRRELPELEPELERPFKTDSARGRLDLVLADSLVLEMKHSVTASETQRAAGQLMQYALLWGQRGPVILIICETAEEFERSLICELVSALRASGLAVIAVAAGFSAR